MSKSKSTAQTSEPVVDKDYPLDHVPLSARQSLLSLSCVLIGFTFFTPTMASGAMLGRAFPFDQLCLVIIVGSLVLGLYVSIMCYISARTGLTAVLQSRYTFGTAGAKWADIILGATQVFWYGITAEYMGDLFAKGLGLNGSGWKIFFIVFWGVVMGITAIYGVKAMSIVSYVAIPSMGALMVLVLIMAIREAGSLEAIRAIVPTEEMTFASAVTVIVGTFASGGTQAGNWGRFAKNGKHAFVAGLLGFLIGNGVMIFSGMMGGLVFGTGDLIELMLSIGITFWAILILTLNIWTTNNATAYAFGVAGSELFGRNNKNPYIIGGIIIALVISIVGIVNYFMPLLNLLGTFVPPLGGAIIGDYFFYAKGRIPKLQYVQFRAIRVAPLIGYLLGCAAAYFGGVFNVGLPALQGIAVSAVAVPVICTLFRKLGIQDEHQVAPGAEYVS